jgi:hypothetical protein
MADPQVLDRQMHATRLTAQPRSDAGHRMPVQKGTASSVPRHGQRLREVAL